MNDNTLKDTWYTFSGFGSEEYEDVQYGPTYTMSIRTTDTRGNKIVPIVGLSIDDSDYFIPVKDIIRLYESKYKQFDEVHNNA